MKALHKVYDLLCIFLMAILAVMVILSVYLRYVHNMTFVWAEEAISFVFIATTYLGVVIGVRDNEHISISVIKDKNNRLTSYIKGIYVLHVFHLLRTLHNTYYLLYMRSLHFHKLLGSLFRFFESLFSSYLYLIRTVVILTVRAHTAQSNPKIQSTCNNIRYDEYLPACAPELFNPVFHNILTGST